jgi:hypothetical protein
MNIERVFVAISAERLNIDNNIVGIIAVKKFEKNNFCVRRKINLFLSNSTQILLFCLIGIITVSNPAKPSGSISSIITLVLITSGIIENDGKNGLRKRFEGEYLC